MSSHQATINWQRTSPGFSYQEYNRDHQWHFEGGITLQASAATQFLGNAALVDPEEAFVASVSSCHMLTFLAICARKRIIVNSYEDPAVGFLEENEHGKLAVTRIVLSPIIGFGDQTPDESVLESIHHLSHKECFIANSILTNVELSRNA